MLLLRTDGTVELVGHVNKCCGLCSCCCDGDNTYVGYAGPIPLPEGVNWRK